MNILFRAMSAADIDAVAELDRLEWFEPTHLQGSTVPEEVEVAAARLDTLTMLARATFGVVAEDAGRVVGVAVAQVDGQPPIFEGLADECAALKAQLAASPAGAEMLRIGEESIAINEELAASPRSQCGGEFLLYLVDAAYRGRGIGGELWRRVRDAFRAGGAAQYYLFTDTTCDWQVYEAKGLTRAAERLGVPDVAGSLSDKFIYVGTP